MIKKNNHIMYPVHGLGKVADVMEKEVNNVKDKYYKLQFVNTEVIVYVPSAKMEDIGLRRPLGKAELKGHLDTLKKPLKIQIEIAINDGKKLLNTGKIEDTVALIREIRAIEKKHKEKILSLQYKGLLSNAILFLGSEVRHVLGEKAVIENELFEE